MNARSYYARKLHSLLGVIPLGLFIVEHALTNYSAFERGPEGFQRSVDFLHNLPLVFFLELFIIWLPILFHGVYGLYIAYQSDINVGRFSYGRNWAFALQRISGVITFIFVAWHFYETRFQVTLGNTTYDELGQHMHQIASDPVHFVLYIIGAVAAMFHFANGIWSFLVSWGITIGPRAQRVSSHICMGIFVILSLLFILSLIGFRSEEFALAAAGTGL
jgi:succinate dehydrogenase / fumarate reductase cytochrome b subunit